MLFAAIIVFAIIEWIMAAGSTWSPRNKDEKNEGFFASLRMTAYGHGKPTAK
jgi:hypothetical protein